MKRVAIALTCLLCLIAPAVVPPAAGQSETEKLFLDAGAKEQAVRTALSSPEVTVTVLKAVRTVVADYENIVKRFPSSAYCDDALWRAGQLSLTAYTRFGDETDKAAGIRLLRSIAPRYPSSKFVKDVPSALAAVESRNTKPAEAPPRAAPSLPTRSSATKPPQPVRTTGVAAPARIVTIKSIRRVVLPDAVRIVIELDGEVASFHDERLANPIRVFVDLSATQVAPDLVDRTIRFDSDADVVRQVRLGRHPNNTTRVVVDASGITSYSVYPLYSPYRLVLDFVRDKRTVAAAVEKPIAAGPPAAPPSVKPAPVAVKPLAEPARSPVVTAPRGPLEHRRIVSQVVTSLFRPVPPRPLRPVDPTPPLLLASPIKVSKPMAVIRPLPGIAGVPRPAPPPAPPLPAKPTTTATVATVPPTPSPTASTAPESEGTAATTTAPAKPNIAGGFSMARQLGLGVSRIVIDPGHGGHDPGGVIRGTSEAEIVLDVALRLEKLLAKTAGVEVILTRRKDEFLGLQERTAIANREGADLFLSIHANANTNTTASGVETYFLNFATNASAAAIAARENAGSGQAMGALPDFVKMIALSNKTDESRDFATFVQRAMVEQLRPAHKGLKDLGVKQAPFVVLIGAAMPSVLAEISFLTNPQEARLLRTSSYRQKAAEALFEAIRKYQASLKTETKVATQQ
jgi:N-acetylmuramoyl-L-alanine amidase